MKLAIVYLLIAVAFIHKSYGNRTMLEEYEMSGSLTFLNNQNRAADCTGVTGIICGDEPGDCPNSFMCLTPGGTPIKIPCPEGQNCNGGKCTAAISPLCEYKGLTFKCTTEGMYPEPSSCKKYNYCVPDSSGENAVDPTPIPGTCPTGWGYNPANTFCDKKLVNNNCAEIDRAVPQCKEAGKNEALRTNPVLFYVCLPYSDDDPTLYPLILKCPDNQKFIGNLQCR